MLFYNGNIAEQHWGHGTTTPNRFVYAYDALDRLTSGISTTSAMSESMAYDNMGNITSLTRDGGTAITYSYSGNRLTALSGGISSSYTYNANGNALEISYAAWARKLRHRSGIMWEDSSMWEVYLSESTARKATSA